MHGQILLGTLCHFRITLNHQMIDLIPAVPGKPLKKPHDLLLLLSNSKPLCFCVGTSGEQPCGSTGKSEVSWRNRKIPFHLHYSRLASSFLHSWKQHYVKGNSISVTLETGLVSERTLYTSMRFVHMKTVLWQWNQNNDIWK